MPVGFERMISAFALAFALSASSVPNANAYTVTCTRPATLAVVSTQIAVPADRFEGFLAALRRFAKAKHYAWGPSSDDAPGTVHGLLLALDSPNGESITISNLTQRDLIDARMAECRDDEETPWLPYWRHFMQFVRDYQANDAH